MTNQFSSEQDLFEPSEEITPELQNQSKRKSLGPKLPISPPSKMSGSGKTENGKGKGHAKKVSGGYSGTQLGFGGMSPSEENPQVLIGTKDDGTEFQVDLLNSVFAEGLPSGQFEGALNYLHAQSKLDFAGFIDNVMYQGFDREFYIKAALKKVSVSVFCRFAILGAVRGSNFQKILNSCIDMPQDLINLVNNNVVAKKAKKREDLTILRFTASIPHWVAFWLFTVDMPKKIESEECPGWLQFPGAASIPMGKKQRLQHISFCKAFSGLLPGGSFNGNIYYTAFVNQVPPSAVPSIIKDGLGISESDKESGVISFSEVQDLTTKVVTKTS